MNKISLYLMSEKGFNVLLNIINHKLSYLINCVVSTQDANVENDFYHEIKDICKKNDILFFDRNENNIITSQYIFAISWRWIINYPSEIIVFHDSLLPKYKGFSPLVNSLINFEEKIGVTAILAVEDYDEGPIISKKQIKIQYPIKIQEAINLIIPLYSELCLEILYNIQNNIPLNLTKQNQTDASYSVWRDEDDYRINWNSTSKQILQFIYSVGYPYKGATSIVNGEKIHILDADIIQDVKIENREQNIGKVIFFKENKPIVICKEGLLKISCMVDQSSQPFSLKKFRTKFL